MVTEEKLAKLNKAIDELNYVGFFRALQKDFIKEPVRILDPFWDNNFNGYIILTVDEVSTGLPRVNICLTKYDGSGWTEKVRTPSSYAKFSITEMDKMFKDPKDLAEEFKDFLRRNLINNFLKVTMWGSPGKSSICL